MADIAMNVGNQRLSIWGGGFLHHSDLYIFVNCFGFVCVCVYTQAVYKFHEIDK